MRLLSLVLLGLVSLQPVYLYAQSGPQEEDSFDLNSAVSISGSEMLAQPEGLVSCESYYRFGSTPVVITGSLDEVAAGTELAFNGTIGNENNYPIKDASLWVKVLKSRTTEKDQNGPEVVDWFNVVDSIDIPAQDSVSFAGSWPVPHNARNGQYQIVTFVVSSDRFNFQGLSFTDDVVGVGYPFSVVNGMDEGVYFAKDEVEVAGYPFAFAAFPPRVEQSASVPVRATIRNDQEVPFKGQVEWKLYSWDAVSEDHLIDQKVEEVELHPGATTTVSYEVNDTEHTVYYAIASLYSTEDGAKSIIGMRVVRDGIETPRFNFVGIHPDSDEGRSAVACFHSTGLAPSDSARVELSTYRSGFIGSLLNLVGPVSSTMYEGKIGTEIYALAMPVTEDSTVVTASLWQGDQHIDTVTIDYCAGACASSNEYAVTAIAVLAGAVLILLLIRILMKRKKVVSPNSSTPPYAN